jgi:hypothetical protein
MIMGFDMPITLPCMYPEQGGVGSSAEAAIGGTWPEPTTQEDLQQAMLD